jgi:tRNA-dihydrouridine synthase A
MGTDQHPIQAVPTPPVSVAPMMDRTDRHFRWLLRAISPNTLLYTEMVTANALLYGDAERLLAFSEFEHPVAIQLGGDDPASLATCAAMAEAAGYDEVNLNVGCPSDRVQKGCFGAVLMRRPEVVAACVAGMREATRLPVTVKHRIGVDELDSYADMLNFVRVVAEARPARFSVHARKAWLQGLSPKENRNVPPLRHELVWRLKEEHPELTVEINGGIKTHDQIAAHLEHVDAVMIGRAAVDNPWLFADVDRRFFGVEHTPDRVEVAQAVGRYADRWVEAGGKPHHVTRHLVNLFAGQPGSRAFRSTLTQRVGAGVGPSEAIDEALAKVASISARVSAYHSQRSDPHPPETGS